MDSKKVSALMSTLHARVAGREHALKTIRQSVLEGTFAADPISSVAVNQAHIDEMEYVLEKLGEILSNEV